MLLIRSEQMASLDHYAARQFVDSELGRLAEAIGGLEPHEIEARADTAAKKIVAYGFTSIDDRARFLRLCFYVGPEFDRYERFQSMLAQPVDLPDFRLSTMFVNAAAEDWDRAAAVDINYRYAQEPAYAEANRNHSMVTLSTLTQAHMPEYFRMLRHPDVCRGLRQRPCKDIDTCGEQTLGSETTPYRFAILHGSTFIGSIWLTQVQDGYALSYWLGRLYWGRGLANAAVRALLKRIQPPNSGMVLKADCLAENLASVGVLTKSGFRNGMGGDMNTYFLNTRIRT